jgi:NADH-quinone oxidoreductase subunit G
MPTINLTIDGQAVSVEAGTSILNAAKSLSKEVPHYCYHPGLTTAGNCRMCLVQVEKMPKPVTSCNTPVSEGMIVHTDTPEVKNMQKSIMEFLLINHPLDCPTCDQAGECRLQDYYMKFDKVPSRFQEEKVHKDKMVDLGAGIMLDEERCIVCTRCVRFCDEIAKTPELYMQHRGDHSMVATFPGKPMSNPYAGCTADVCPVGALTTKDFRYKKRVWFLKSAKSVCPGCSRGCNIEIHHADEKVFRLKPRHNPEVNNYWMCDAGRYDYKFINEARRLKSAWREKGQLVSGSTAQALAALRSLLATYKPGEIACVASARESNQAIDAFVGFAHEQLDAAHVYFSKNDPDHPFSDTILITADKNPNLAHVQKLGLKPLRDLPANVKAVIVQRDLSESDLLWVRTKKLPIVLLFATNLTPADDLAQVILPLATYAEQAGSFTNCQGLVQDFEPALIPAGEAREITSYLSDLIPIIQGLRKAS